MAAPTAALLQDTQKLVDLYSRYERFRGVFWRVLESKRPVFYKGRPLKTYVYLINSFYPNLAQLYGRDYKKILESFGKDDDFFLKYRENELKYKKLQDKLNEGGYLGNLPEEDRKEIERIEQIKDRKTKKEQYERWSPKTEPETKQETQPAASPVSLPKVPTQLSSPAKDAASFAKIQTRKVLVNVLDSERISSFVGAVGNTILGGGGRVAGGSLDAAERATQMAAAIPQLRAIMAAKAAASRMKYVIIGIVVLFLIAFLPGGTDLFTKTPLLHDFLGEIAPPGSPQPGTPIYTSSDLAQCKFTRSDQNPREASFQSPLLLSYFQEASQLSGIPAALLAAFVRVESPSSVNLTDQQLTNFCPQSPTGALGIMQIQPANTTGHDSGAVGNGASYIGKTAATLTREDYCDVKKNILIGTGFIIHKMSYSGYRNGGEVGFGLD